MVTITQRADTYPFVAYNFSVEIDVPAIAPVLCLAAFSECDGLEMTMDVKTIREGGNNTRQIRLIGPVNYGQVTLKRGMTANFDLWDWFDAQQQGSPQQLRGDLRGEAKVILLSSDRQEQAHFLLKGCLLTKLKAPPLNAKDGVVAIEEMQLTYESMSFEQPTGGGNA
ncbi:MAG TPA: phage tail protein [Thermoanaerobaculia bacterium]|nr:phage tail protein [Thermoanaerobaculia bacterium]